MASSKVLVGAAHENPQKRNAFAALALAGLISCQVQPVVPPVIGVKGYLSQNPMGLAEEGNEPTAFPLNGKIARCRGAANCSVEVYPGDVLMNLRFGDENEGNMEVTVSAMGGDRVVLQRRMDVRPNEPSYDTQTLLVGESTVLFNTDVTVCAMKGDQGRFFIQVFR